MGWRASLPSKLQSGVRIFAIPFTFKPFPSLHNVQILFFSPTIFCIIKENIIVLPPPFKTPLN